MIPWSPKSTFFPAYSYISAFLVEFHAHEAFIFDVDVSEWYLGDKRRFFSCVAPTYVHFSQKFHTHDAFTLDVDVGEWYLCDQSRLSSRYMPTYLHPSQKSHAEVSTLDLDIRDWLPW